MGIKRNESPEKQRIGAIILEYLKEYPINLKKVIDESNLSINSISHLTGIPYSTLSDLVKGKRKNISFQNIILICDVLNCPIDYLTGRNGLDYNEMKVIEKYRKLDERGKKNIDNILDIEIKNKDILV